MAGRGLAEVAERADSVCRPERRFWRLTLTDSDGDLLVKMGTAGRLLEFLRMEGRAGVAGRGLAEVAERVDSVCRPGRRFGGEEGCLVIGIRGDGGRARTTMRGVGLCRVNRKVFL